MYRLLHEVEEFHYFRNLRAIAIMVIQVIIGNSSNVLK